jgi:hypothetical protein
MEKKMYTPPNPRKIARFYLTLVILTVAAIAALRGTGPDRQVSAVMTNIAPVTTSW